jgi:6,7-dimethyl-8-ribityllumazine synthase
MLKRLALQRHTPRKGPAGRFAIVASKYNRRYVDALLRAAKRELIRGKAESLRIIRVPGAFEIPAVVARVVSRPGPRLSAIICLGVIFRGETTHARQIADAVSLTLAQLQSEHKIAVIHGVYLFENQDQARVRCLGRKHNRGIEVARTALEMARVMDSI